MFAPAPKPRAAWTGDPAVSSQHRTLLFCPRGLPFRWSKRCRTHAGVTVSVIAMTLRIRRFTNEYAELAAWTGEPEVQLRAQNDLHEDDRELWLAWDGEHVVGAVHPWLRPDSRQVLYFEKCRADAYAPLAAVVGGECYSFA